MKKSLGRALSWVLCLSLLWGVVAPTGALAARNDETPETPVLDGIESVQSMETPIQAEPLAADGEYEIYPTPQSVSYGTGTVTLPATMQVTYGAGIDEYTKDRAVEAFGEAGVTLSESATTAIKLQVSIGETSNPTKYDAYDLTIDQNGVTVVGKDTDAAFYGLTTVKRILQQVTGRQVKHLTVEDYADVAFRGFIEGYYGNPWTVEDRAALMEFGGELKQNIYFYAPKDDPKHSSKWRELYTDEELETLIRPLAEAGNKSKCYYGFALHPFWADGINYADETQYQADLGVLKAKFEQVMSVGVRQIAILADDRGLPTVNSSYTVAQNTRASYVKLMTDLTNWVKSDEMQAKYPGLKTSIPFCPNDYMSNATSDQIQTLVAELPDSVPIIQTGGTIWGQVSHSYLNSYRTNTHGGGTFMWVNWPCSDKSKGSLTMGAHDIVLHDDLTDEDIATLKGIMLNPMQQSEPSKQAIFTNADYSWNIWNGADAQERKDNAWNDSFKYVDHDSAIETPESAALREMGKHMIHQNGSVGWHEDYPESKELAPKLTAFRNKLSAGTVTDADIEAIREEFVTLHDAAVLYKNKTTGNLRILGQRKAGGGYVDAQEQMAPWLDYWVEFTQANLDLLDALALMQNNADGSKDSDIVEKYLSGQGNLTAARAHSFLYMDHDETAIAGGMHIVPFTNELLSPVSEAAKTILDPSVFTETIITNRSDTPEGGLAAMRDGDTSTIAVFKNPNSISVGTYVGVRYNQPISVTSVRFEVGAANTNDTFNDSKLQYMNADGQWVDIPGATFTHTDLVLEATGLDLTTKGVRAIATSERTGTWFGVKEIYINGQSGSAEAEPETASGQLTGTVIKSSRWEVYEGPESNLIDNDDNTTVWYKETGDNKDASIVGDYLGLDLGRVVKNVGRVRFVVGNGSGADKWTNFKLQYSTDNTNWTDVNTYTSTNNQDVIEEDLGSVAARYVRFVNTQQVNKWLYFAELSVWADDAATILYQSDTVKKITNPVGALANDSASLSADNISLRPGEFVGIALPRIRKIVELIADYTPAPGLVLKVGMSEADLQPVETYVGYTSGAVRLFAADDAVTDFTGLARYIRLENESKQNISFRLNELSVKSDEIEELHFEEEMTNMGFDTNYGNQDNRTTTNFFDGNMSTVTTLANGQTAGEYVTYDLGQLRPIRKLTMAMQESNQNYLRHGVLEVSPTGEDGSWITVLTVNNDGADYTEVKDGAAADPSFRLGVPSQNCVSFVGELDEAVDARYLRIRVTQGGRSTFIAASEILINTESLNDMEYVRASNDPTFDTDPIEPSADYTPDKMLDGDLTTGFRPNMSGKTSGYFSYRLSGETSIGQINVVQDTANLSNATVEIRTANGWQTLSGVTLSKGLNQIMIPEDVSNVLELKLSWGNVTPTFYEIITIPRAAVAESGGQAASDPETIPINSYSGTDRVINFDENWKFNLGDASGAEAAVYNDASWRTLNLPHDFSIEQDYTSAGEAESGYLPGGTGWYRKSFTIDPTWENSKVISIDFGGAYMETEVYLNGHKLGENKNGYNPFSFVLPAEYLNYTGENVVAVKVVNTLPSSRWYSGSGIYRSVNLTVTDRVHVARYGTYVNPVKGTGNSWTVNVKTNVQNDGPAAANVTVEQAIYELDSATYERKGSAVVTASGTAAAPAAGATAEVTQTLNVSNPKLWNSWDRGEPNLYVLVTTVKQGSTVLDTYETEFGFRTIEFTTDVGFKLNGVNTKLKGVCQHHDQGALGAEGWYRALERQVEILMDMGCNSIRVTHNPADDKLIEICNRKGILIIDEAFDCWDRSKNGNSNDFARFFNVTIASDNAVVGGAGKSWSQFVLESMINRDKNAPCVIMYSLGNEILATSPHEGFVTIATNLVAWAKAIDATRPVTMGDDTRTTSTGNTGVAERVNAIIAANGVVGFNYCHTRGRDVMPTAHNNGWVIYGSETASHVNSRGIYTTKGNASLNSDKLLTSYDKSRVGWGDTVAGAWWYTIRFDYNMGEYIWTGFDYIGEPTPANGTGTGWVNGWAADAPKSSFFGAIDTNGLPKDSYWLYRALWNETDTTLHVLPTWDEDDIMLDANGKVEVAVYSNAPVVRVYLNGVEVGASQAEETTTPAGHKYRTYKALALTNGGTNTFQAGSTAHSGEFTGTALYSTFMVPYAAGNLEVKAFDSEGREITNTTGRDIVRTTSGASKLVSKADRATIKNDGRDLSYITISVTDKNGNIVNGATDLITVSVSGDGVFMGLDNGVQPDHTSYLSNTRKAGAGQLVAIVQSTKTAGTFTLTATAPGLTPTTVTVSTGGAASDTTGTAPVSYDLAKTVYVQLNTEPTLPTTATVNLANGTSVTKSVTWSEYDKSLLSTAGSEFAITGTIADYNIAASIGVVVLDDIAALLNYSAAVQVGEVPTLPTSRPAVMADGTVVSAQFEVKWEEPDAKVYNKAGTVVVSGTAEAFGKTYNVTATIRVAKPSYVEGSEAVVGTTIYEKGESKGTLATYNPAYADHNTNTSVSVQGAIGYSFDTAQNIYKITLTYNGTPPTSGVTIATSGTGYQPTEAANSWQTIRATGVVSGNTVTYQLDKPVSTEALKFTFANQVKLADILLTNGLSVFPIGATAEFDGLKVNGLDATESQLASKVITTSAENAVITPVSDDNVAVTILPENSDSQIIVVTESEDHTSRAVYTIQLDATPDADDASNDYPYNKTTATAPSQHGADTSATEGPASFAVDGREASFWHSRWSSSDNATGSAGNSQGQGDLANYPDERYIQLALQEAATLTALRYYPRTGNSLNGTVTEYRVEVSTNGTNWTKVSEGTWARTHDWKIAEFDQPVTAKYVRLYGVHTYADTGNDRFMSCSELRVVTADNRIDLSAATITLSKTEFHWKNLDLRPGAPSNSNVDDDVTVTVTLYGEVLEPGVDYELDYDNNVDPGTAYVYARALANSTKYQGAAATTFQIVQTEDKITSFQPVNVRVYPGVAPELPTEVLAIKEDGHRASVPVIWDDVPEDWYNYPQEKTRILNGTIEDLDMLAEGVAMPTITLKFAFSLSADTVSLVTPVGVVPVLPATVTVRFDDGTSAERTVTWDLTDVDFDTAGTVEIKGDIEGVDRAAAKATVRVAESTASADNFAANTAVRNGATVGSLPLAISWEGCPADNAFNATNGAHPNSTASGKKIWCDWESGDYNNNDWFGVIFGNGDTLEVKTVNQVKLWFVAETGANGCKPPKAIKIQYYDGPDFIYYTQLSVANESRSNKTNNMVSAWGNDHPFADPGNWKDVSVTGSYPSSYSAGTEYAISFSAVSTKVIRVLFEHQDNQWIGLDEMEVYGLNAPVANSDFTVTSITLGGEEKLNAFQNKVLTVELAQGAAIPKLAVTATDNASIAITQASSVPGTAQAGGAWAQAVITSEDGSKTETYTVKFTREGSTSGYFIDLDISSNADKLTVSPMGGAAGTEITVSVKKGYQLTDLWITVLDGDREGELIRVTDGKFVMPAGNVTFSAGVSPIVYTLTYNLNGGSVSLRNPSRYTVETASFTLNNPTKAGYTFVGWIGGGLTTPTPTVTVQKGSIGERAYTAVWSENGSDSGNNGGNTGNGGGGTAAVTPTPSVTEEGDRVVTTTAPDGSTTVTTETPAGVTTQVTTSKDGEQTATIAISENAIGAVDAVMPALIPGKDAESAPTVTVTSAHKVPTRITIPVEGEGTTVAVRVGEDGTQTIVPMSVVDEDGLHLFVEDGQTYKIIDNKKDFDDVPDTFWGASAVDFVASRELFNGVADRIFAPSQTMNRAMLVTVLWRMSEKPESSVENTFHDVSDSDYYAEAVRWGVENNVITGTDLGFEPKGTVTREMLATMLYRAAGSPGVVDEMPRRFVDAGQVSGWAEAAMIWAVQNGIIQGREDNTLAPRDGANRAETAAMLQRYINLMV